MASAPAPCAFFAKGACRNGSACRFAHYLPGASTADKAKAVLAAKMAALQAELSKLKEKPPPAPAPGSRAAAYDEDLADLPNLATAPVSDATWARLHWSSSALGLSG